MLKDCANLLEAVKLSPYVISLVNFATLVIIYLQYIVVSGMRYELYMIMYVGPFSTSIGTMRLFTLGSRTVGKFFDLDC